MPPAARRSSAFVRSALPALAALLALLALAAPRSLRAAATVPAGFSDAVFASNLSAPTAMQFAPDGRLFICQQGGALRVVKNGQLLPQPFLTLNVNSQGERGLLGLAFDPDFATNGWLYLYYTTSGAPIHNRISRFTASGDVAAPGSEVTLMDLDNLSGATNHNGGAMHFGPDGKLYAAVGDNANSANAQTLANRLGKMLRLNRDGTIPTDNPFVGSATGANRAIWARGLRNPFTFAFKPGASLMHINDVGEAQWEEINEGIAGANYGWPAEGPDGGPGTVLPLYYYHHSTGSPSGCAITGGAFYVPPVSQFPAQFAGDYFFADYCGGWIYAYDGVSVEEFATGISFPVDLKVGPDGALYYLARGSSSVGRISFTQDTAPTITQHPADRTVAAGQTAEFTVSAAGTPPLSYRWQRGVTDIPNATGSAYSLTASAGDNGAQFRVVVTNAFGSATSDPATLTVTTNTPPTGSISQPAGGATYTAGSTVNYAGTGTDAEDGTLPADAFRWRVDFHHADHTHPFIADTSGSKGGSFVAPNTGETATNVFYRIHLTVTDSGGLTHASFRDIVPRIATLTLRTDPPGLQVTLDGQPKTTPHAESSVIGMRRVLGAPSPQTLSDATYRFQSWSDGGAQTHTIATPASGGAYTARFRRKPGRLSLSTTRIQFRETVLGDTDARPLTVRNTGEGILQVAAGAPKAPYSVANGGAFALAPGASRLLQVRFTPGRKGLHTRSLAFTSDDPDRARASVQLRGRGR